MRRPPPTSTLFPYTTLFRSVRTDIEGLTVGDGKVRVSGGEMPVYFARPANVANPPRSEEHTSELQSQSNLVCRLLLEKKKLLPDTAAPDRHPVQHHASGRHA